MRLFIIFCSIVDICCFCVYTLQLLPIAVRPYEADVVYTGDRGQSLEAAKQLLVLVLVELVLLVYVLLLLSRVASEAAHRLL